jgi:hypothetical protein
VNGSGFVQGSRVSFNLNNMPTKLVSSSQLRAAIPASAIAIAGNPYVVVTNPDGSTSAALTFTVIPSLGTVTPPSLPAGSNALTLNVTGTGFAPGSVVLVNGSARVTVFESSNSLQATLLPSDLAQGGTLNITVMNPPPGGGISAVISFTVADYKVTPPSSDSPVLAGQTANFALTVASMDGTFSNPVTFGISPLTPLPADAIASFAPSATITPGATPQTVTLFITTMPHTAASVINFRRGPFPILMFNYLVGTVFVLAGLSLLASGDRVRRLARQLLLAMLMVATAGLVACGAVGGGPSSPPQPNPATGTPAGTYPITVTATSGGVSHSTTVTLTVM